MVELTLFVSGVVLYGRARGFTPRLLWLAGILIAVHLANLFGPPPPNPLAVTLSALALAPLLWFWGNRVDSLPER